MEIYKQYDVFKEKCTNFSTDLENRCFKSAKLICHPTIRNEIIAVCSDEEARSNALHICRMSDMLLMSENNENWVAFNLAEARKITEQNGFIYLTDLFSESAFHVEDWMINGKNDTIVVSEEYMREKGKKYAPVTPLTNKVMHFKKSLNDFFWKKSEDGNVVIIDNEHIQNCIIKYFNECTAELETISNSEPITLPLFDDKVSIDLNTTRVINADNYFEKMNKIIDTFVNNSDILEISEYKFSIIDFLIELTISALKNDDINISKDDFLNKYYCPVADLEDEKRLEKLAIINVKSGNADIDCIKYAYVAALMDKKELDFKYPAVTAHSYGESMRSIELGKSHTDEEKYELIKILSQKPDDFMVFAYLYNHYPQEKENIDAIVSFWNIEPMSDEDIQLMLYNAYIPADSYNIDGEFCPDYENALIIYENLLVAEKKYSFENSQALADINDYIKNIDHNSRSFNGTLFESKEDMKKAMQTETEMRDLCVDLSAMTENELLDLRKYIMALTLDNKNKAKYLIKIKVALNNCTANALEQLCIDVPVLELDDAVKLKDKILKSDYDDAIAKPFIKKIDSRILTAEREELNEMFNDIDNMTDAEIDEAKKSLNSNRYSDVLKKYYNRKINACAENKIVNDISSMCNGFEDFDIEKLKKLKSDITVKNYSEKYTYKVFKKINSLMVDFEKNQLVKLFENIDFADNDEIDSIKAEIKKNNYNEDLLAPYLKRISSREQELLDEELIDLCKNIDGMTQDQLSILKIAINESEKTYDDALVEKYNDKIAQREVELSNTELAELCKYIFSMEFDALYELKDVLESDKYDPDLTAVYIKKISEREVELNVIELEKLCEDIMEMDIEQLEELKNTIFDEDSYANICDPFILKINNRIEEIKLAEYNAMLATVVEMDTEALEKFRKHLDEIRLEVGDDLYEIGVKKADDRADDIELDELEEICSDVDNFDFEKTISVINDVSSDKYKDYNSEDYIEKLNNHITDLHIKALDEITSELDSMNKDELNGIISKINKYGNDCPSNLKAPYIEDIEQRIRDLAEKEVRDLCGDVASLSVKKSFELIRLINFMSIDSDIKNQYLDSLDAHIMSIKEHDCKEYITFLTQKMTEFSVTSTHILVPTMTNNFFQKYDAACKQYVSCGRYEMPILMHEAAVDEGFTLTTEFLYYVEKPNTINKIKVDDLASFQAKKGLVVSILTVIDKNGNSYELPNALNKSVIENAAKVLTALACFIRDQRAAEHMKEMLETAVKERTAEIPVQSAIKAPEPPVVESIEIPEISDDSSKNFEIDDLSSESNDEFEFNSIELPDTEEIKLDDSIEVSEVDDDNIEDSDNSDGIEDDKSDENQDVTDESDDYEKSDNSDEVKMKFCEECGAKITNTAAKFCYECGNRLN